jgi:type IV pilus assembly protein PilY1
MGGGYDPCEDVDTPTPTCTDSKGAIVYVIDANTGALIQSFPTGFGRSVVADVALMASTTSSGIDHGYAVDTGGNIFRIDFNVSGTTRNWVMNRVAYTNGSGRKFLFPPALFPNPGNKVYLALGSGDREHPLITQYPYTRPVLNRFYVYRDDLSVITETNLDNVASGSSIINVSPTVGCDTSTASNAANILPTSNSNGWFLNLNQYGTGEQTVTSALIVGGMVTFSTNRPVPAVSGACSFELGEARGYFLNLFNGSGAIGVGDANCGGSISGTFAGGGLPPSPVFANVLIGSTTYPVVIGAIQRQLGASSPISPQKVPPTHKANRKTTYVKVMGTD